MMIDRIIVIDDHPKHKDHLVIDQTMIIDDHHLTVEEEESSFKLNATSEHVEQVSGGAG